MAGIAPVQPSRTSRIRVRLGALTAACRHCEGQHFLQADTPDLLACDACGANVQRAALLRQLSAAASLVAESLARQRLRFASMAD